MVKKKAIKWSKKIEDFVLDEMCKGLEPALIFRKHEDKLPSLRTFNRRQVDDLEFKEKVDAAYTVIYQIKQAELSDLTAKATSELRPDLEFREAAEYKKTRVDALKFELGKLAGVFSRRYDKKTTIEHQGTTTSAIQFILPEWTKHRVIDVEKDDDNQ